MNSYEKQLISNTYRTTMTNKCIIFDKVFNEA